MIIVVPALASEVLLPSLDRTCPAPACGAFGAAFLPRPAPAVVDVAVPVFACRLAARGALGLSLTNTARDAVAVSTLAADLYGEIGLAKCDLGGNGGGRIGDCGRVRELCDLGERICDGFTLREAVLVARAGGADGIEALTRFLGIASPAVSFSLSFSLSSNDI